MKKTNCVKGFSKEYIDHYLNKYENCNHVFVTCGYTSSGDYDDRTIAYKGCIKCGLTTEALDDSSNYYYWGNNNSIMNSFLKSHPINYSIDTMPGKNIFDKFTCVDLDTARNMYLTILKENPNISDDELIRLFQRMYFKCQQNNETKKRYVYHIK